MAKYNTLSALFTAIANSLRRKTGGSGKIVADDFPSVIDGLSTGGITPTGTKNITTNGSHDVTTFATAQVNVPTGITPSGTKTITTNGTHDVTNYASAQVNVPTGITPTGSVSITENGTYDVTSKASAVVNVPGLKARVFTKTISSDVTSGQPTIVAANDWIKSIRSDPNAFIFMRYMGTGASTARFAFWFIANFKVGYGGSTAYNAILLRQTASNLASNFNVNGLTADNYSGHLCVAEDGKVYLFANTTYPLKAGDYQIVAGTVEMI